MQCPHCHRQVKASAKNCSACGGYIPPGQYLLEDAGIIEASLAKATVGAKKTAAPRNVAAPRLAKLGKRFSAFVLDTMVLFGVFAVTDAWIFMRWGTVEGTELSLTAASLLLAGICNSAILFAYGWLLEASFGATLGKSLVGLRVVRTGSGSALGAAAIRNAMRIVDGAGVYLLGAVVAGCSPGRQRLGDLCAGTAVVEEEFSKPKKALALVLWIAVMAGAVWQVPRICSTDVARAHSRYLNRVIVQVGRTENSAYFRIARVRFDVELASATAQAGRM
jgi:uncharacterized RDD family membrane protein YckC